MVASTQARGRTNFTVSIEAATGVTTGISAADRATTIQAAVKKNACADDIVLPGHIFPLQAQKGGVLARAGHTEAGVDLPRLAGLESAGVICEIMNEDGTMARLPQLQAFARLHKLKMGTIADLISYRLQHEATINRVSETNVSTAFGAFKMIAYRDEVDSLTHVALVRGEMSAQEPVLVRVHVQQNLLDSFTTDHRAGSWSLHEALQTVAQTGRGVVVVLHQPENPDALPGHLRAVAQKSAGTAQAFTRLPQRDVLRTYGLGCQILRDLGLREICVLGHAARAPAMSGFGLHIADYISTPAEAESHLKRAQKS